MARLTQEQLEEILRNKPQGTTDEGVISALRRKGHTLEMPQAQEPRRPATETGLYKFGRAITPFGETAGTALAERKVLEKTFGPSISRLQEQSMQQKEALGRQIQQRIKDPNLPKERKELYIRKLQEIDPDIIGQDPELKRIFSKTKLQVVGEAGITAANILAGGVKLPTRALGTGLMPYTSASFVGRLAAGTTAGVAFGASAALAKGKRGFEEVAESGAKAGLFAAGIIGAFEAVPYVIRFLKGSLKRIGAAISGSGLETIDEVIKNPEQALRGLKGDQTKILKQATKAVRKNINTIHKEAIKAYGDDLANIQKQFSERGEVIKLTKQGIKSNLTSQLRKFGVEVNPAKKTFDFLESPFTGSEESILKKAFGYVDDWADLSPTGLNSLAVKLSRLRKAGIQSPQLNSVIDSMVRGTRKYIGSRIPEIAEMNAAYADKMGFIEALRNELSAKGATENVRGMIQTSKKIGTIFGNNKELARELVEKLEVGGELLAVEAGRQVARPVTGASVSLKYLLQAIIPPKLVGEIAAFSGLAQRKIAPIVDALQQLEPLERQSLLNAIKQGGLFD